MPKTLVAILVGAAVAAAIGFGITYLLASNGAEPLDSTWVMAGVIGGSIAMAMMSTSGNRAVKGASAEARKAAVAMSPAPAEAMIVLFREGFMGKAFGIDIALDGQVKAQLKSGRFTALTIAPGHYRLTCILTGSANAASKPGEVSFEIGSGEAAAFRISLAMKMTTSDVVLTRVTDLAAAKAKIARMPMIAPL